jgi:hypothetical protein
LINRIALNKAALAALFISDHPKSGSWAGVEYAFFVVQGKTKRCGMVIHSKELQRSHVPQKRAIRPVVANHKGEHQTAIN